MTGMLHARQAWGGRGAVGRLFWHRQPRQNATFHVKPRGIFWCMRPAGVLFIESDPMLSDVWLARFLADDAAVRELDAVLDGYRVETRKVRKRDGAESIKADERVIRRVFLSADDDCKRMLRRIFTSPTVESRVLMGKMQDLVFEADEACTTEGLSRSKRRRHNRMRDEWVLDVRKAQIDILQVLSHKNETGFYRKLLSVLRTEEAGEDSRLTTVDELMEMLVYVMNPDQTDELSTEERRRHFHIWKGVVRARRGECVRACLPRALGLPDALLGAGWVDEEEGWRTRLY